MNNNHHESHESPNTTKKDFRVICSVSFVFSCLPWQMAGVIDA